MKWFTQHKDKSASLKSKDVKVLFGLIERFLGEITRDLNENLHDDSMKILVKNRVGTKDLESGQRIETTRIQASNNASGLSVRVRGNKIQLFLMPSSELSFVPSTEYPSRLKFTLERHQELTVWLLDGKELTESDLKLLMLTAVNDLVKYATKGKDPTGGARLRIGELSLTTGLRDLLFEKAQLLTDLLHQQEFAKSALAAELHDSVVADLLLLKREIDTRENVPSDRVSSALEEVVQSLRDICAELSSRELQNWGLLHSIGALCQRLSERSGQQIEAILPENMDVQLPYDASLHIYRITQEVLNNALKHSEAKTLQVRISVTEKELSAVIEDDGVGFDFIPARSTSPSSGGMGIPILKERTEMLTQLGFPAMFSLNSTRGTGTTATLTVDLSAAKLAGV